MEIVSVRNLDFELFGNKILKNISFSILENEMILLIGANGAGKSTLLRVLSGFHLPMNYKKFDVLGTRAPQDQFKGLAYLGNKWQRNISFCGVSPYMADIRAGDMMKIWQDENIERRDELVQVLGINLDWKMHRVSDGQRKRVQIMLALLKPFKLLVIDEFLNELDIVVRDRFFRYLKKECKLRNGSVIYATHIFDNLDKWINNVLYISNGELSKKQSISEFNKCGNLFESVKEIIIKDYEKNNEDNIKINPLEYGPQFGYGSGRCASIFVDK